MAENPLVKSWMSWAGGFDVVGLTQAGLSMPNLIIHVAAMVHTPAGSAPSGMVLFQPDPNAAPEICCFVSSDLKVASYFGPTIFAGTPFEKAPAVHATVEVKSSAKALTARIKSASFEIVATLDSIEEEHSYLRSAGAFPPFHQAVIEAIGRRATATINGRSVAFAVPPVGISGGYGAVSSPAGIYTR